MKLTVYMRNVENTMDIELPFTINVEDEVKFKEWMAIVVTRPAADLGASDTDGE